MLQRYLIINPDTPDTRTIVLTQQSYRIGRGRSADIRISSKNVSALHCSLQLDEAGCRLGDLDSTNGTFVNGRRSKKKQLVNGDLITLGDAALRYDEKEVTEDAAHITTAFFRLPESVQDGRLAELLADLKNGTLSSPAAAEAAALLELYGRNNRLLETLYALLERVLAVSDRNAAIAMVLAELRSLLGLEIASLYLVGDNRFGILEDDVLEWSEEYPVVSRSVLTTVLATKKPLVIEEVDGDGSGMKTLMRFKIRSVLCFPVMDREKAVSGVVYCVSRSAGQLELLRDDRHFINACSTFISLVLENLQVIEREKRAASVRARKSSERHFTPIISRLVQERENLSLKLGEGTAGEEFFGLEEKHGGPLREFIGKAAPTGLPVLVTGETGVGKSLFAKVLHRASGVSGPFTVIDCTTIPRELLESELFGHEKGAFTGAHARKEGKVKNADGGTLFIDEIGELDIPLQAKLLRFIQTGEYEPLGSSTVHHSNARIIAATNRDLKSEVAEKRFREDLYYRLNVLAVELPPLRSRPEAVLLFAEHFLRRYAPRLNPAAEEFSDAAKRLLAAYRWPGNIRELENTVMRALVNVQGGRIDADHCSLELQTITEDLSGEGAAETNGDALDLKAARERTDRILITRALESTGRNVSRAAELLRISRNSLMDLMKKYGL
ncbi:MAG: sigma 54-interacting transcriptional regulator [Chitinispirillaceae bacterium]|nr:sigma 54-interacting transcriptional regulator [Chitinispirillaceae bacterium]